MGLTKVFVGNLSFKTKDSDLASEFSSAGKVVSANIITRGPRSLGYGFVELESEEEAQKAVALMNKKNIDTREINVELARPRDENRVSERRNSNSAGGGAAGGNPGGGRGGRGRGYRGGGRGRGGSPGRFGGRGRAYRPRGGQGGGPVGVPVGIPVQNAEAMPAGPSNRGRGRGRGRGRRGGGRGGIPRPFVPKNPSLTTLYVANLPFSTDDAQLSDLFKDLKATQAYVVKAKNLKSKGFGFVEFANNEDQQAALQAAKNFTLNDRTLIVKVAMTENRSNNEENNNDNAPSETQTTPEKDNLQQDQKENQSSST